MPILRKTAIAAICCAAVLLGAGYLAVKTLLPRYLGPEKVSSLITSALGDTLHRKIKFKGAHYGDGEFVIDGLSVAERPSFGTGNFLTVRRVVCKIGFADLAGRRLEISALHLEEPSIYLRRKAVGGWNFSDIPRAFSSSGAPPVQWNIRGYEMTGANISVQDARTGNDFTLSGATGSLSASGIGRSSLKTTLAGHMAGTRAGDYLSGELGVNAVLVRDEGRLSRAEGSVEISSFTFQNLVIGHLSADIAANRLEQPPSARKIALSFYGSDLILDRIHARAKRGGWEKQLLEWTRFAARFKSVAAPELDTLAFSRLEFSLVQNGAAWKLSPLRLEGEGARLFVDSSADALAKSATTQFDLQLGELGLAFASEGPLSHQRIRPHMAETLDRGLGRLFLLIEKSLVNYYAD